MPERTLWPDVALSESVKNKSRRESSLTLISINFPIFI